MKRSHQRIQVPASTLKDQHKVLDCTKCSACCFGLAVYLTKRESRLYQANQRLRLLIKPQDDHFCMRRTVKESRCFALKGRPGCCTCKVYDQRPRICREFEPGSETCLRSRKAFGID